MTDQEHEHPAASNPAASNKVVSLHPAETIEDEAASWLIALSREDSGREDVEAFQKWAGRSPRHRETFDRLAALWDDMAALETLNDHAAAVAGLVTPRRVITRRASIGLAASLGIGLVAAGLFATQPAGRIAAAGYETAVGEQRSVRLPDGSLVQLNTATRIAVDYRRGERRITLVEGEAFFDVAKDARRPFLVYAGDGYVRAVGTAFTVRLHAEKTLEVTVEEGRVALANARSEGEGRDPGRDTAPARELAAGDNAFFSRDVERVGQLPAAEISRRLSWRQGVLAYAGEPLSDVVADISRYTDITIEIADPAVASRPIGGYFRVGDVEEMFDSLELNFGLKVERTGARKVRLTDA